MKDSSQEVNQQRAILSRLSAGSFLDRQAELERLRALPLSKTHRIALLVGGPRTGKTALLREVFDQFFHSNSSVAPFFFSFSGGPAPELFAASYLSTFVAQFLAFRHRRPEFLSINGEPLAALPSKAPGEDYGWIRDLVRNAESLKAADPVTRARAALSAGILVVEKAGLVPFNIFDDIDNPMTSEGGVTPAEMFFSSDLAYAGMAKDHRLVFSGLQRPVLAALPADNDFYETLQIIKLGRLDADPVEAAILSSATAYSVAVSDSTVELMAQQLGGDLFYAKTVIAAAAARGASLKTFIDFERTYTDELLGGRLKHYFDSVIDNVAPEPQRARATLEVLEMLADAEGPLAREPVVARVSEYALDAEKLLRKLHDRELLTLSADFVHRSEDPVLLDYVRARYRREVAGFRAPIVGSELLSQKLKQSYRLMMLRYNSAVESQLIETLSGFEFQSAPACLFDDAAFDGKFRGSSRVVIRRALETDTARIRLPQMTDISDAGFSQHAGMSWQLYVAGGFEGGIYSDASEVTWLIALVNSKEPLDLETLGRIDQRLELSAQSRLQTGNQPRYLRWYISKEGFSAAASERLRALGAHHSTYVQLDLLHDCCTRARADEKARPPISEFDLVIPVENDSELIAVRTVEQIARAAEFDSESINQIKTALVEACLNAAEHSNSPDRRIYQHFAITEDSLVIRVSNKGSAFTLMDNDSVAGSRNRGRGLQIIRALMDEVRFERTDEGASLVMVKRLKRPQALSKPQTA